MDAKKATELISDAGVSLARLKLAVSSKFFYVGVVTRTSDRLIPRCWPGGIPRK